MKKETKALIGMAAVFLIGVLVILSTWDRNALAAQSTTRVATIEVKSVPGIDNMKLVVYNGILVCPVQMYGNKTINDNAIVCTQL